MVGAIIIRSLEELIVFVVLENEDVVSVIRVMTTFDIGL